MKFWVQLQVIALLTSISFSEEFIGFFGDGNVLSSGIQFIGRFEGSQPDEFQTGTPYEVNTWNAHTGELITSTPIPLSRNQNSSSYFDWDDANTIAYSEKLETLVLIRRDTSEIIGTHTFEGHVVMGFQPLPDSRILVVSTQSKPPENQTFPTYVQIASVSHLVDTGTGKILRSIESKTRNQSHFRLINEGKSILALRRGNSLHSSALNIAADPQTLFQSASEIRILDINTGLDQITPILTDSPPRFGGSSITDEEENILYAVLNSGEMNRVDLNNFTVSVFSIEGSDNVTNLVRIGNTLGSLLTQVGRVTRSTSIVFWDADTLAQTSRLERLQSASDTAIQSFLPVPGEDQLIIAGQSGEIELWEHSPPRYLRTIGNAMNEVHYWAISPDGKKLLTFSTNEDSNVLHVWDMQEGGLLVENSNPRDSHVGSAAYFSDDSQRIFWYDSRDKLVATRLLDGQIDFSIPESPSSAIACGYFENGSKRMLVHSEGTVQIFDEEDNVSTFNLNANDVHPHHIDRLDGLLLYQASSTLYSYDPSTNTIKTLWDLSDSATPTHAYLNPEATRLLLFWNNVDDIDFPGFPGFPGTSQPSRIQLVDLQNPDAPLVTNLLPANGIALSPDGTHYAVSITEPNAIYIYDSIERNSLLQRGWTSAIDAITYSSDGKSLFILSDNQIHRLDVSTGEIIGSHPIATVPIPSILFQYRLLASPNGEMLAVFEGVSLSIFLLPDFQEVDFLFPLPIFFTTETQFAFSPNEQRFLSIDFLSNANEWHFRRGSPINRSSPGVQNGYPTISFQPNPESIYSFQQSSDLKNWRYSVLKGTNENNLSGFPLYPSDGHPIFGRIIEFPKPD